MIENDNWKDWSCKQAATKFARDSVCYIQKGCAPSCKMNGRAECSSELKAAKEFVSFLWCKNKMPALDVCTSSSTCFQHQ